MPVNIDQKYPKIFLESMKKRRWKDWNDWKKMLKIYVSLWFVLKPAPKLIEKNRQFENPDFRQKC